MEELHWTEEQKEMARSAIMEHIAINSVAKQFIPKEVVNWTETTVKWNCFDFQRRIVSDRFMKYPINSKVEKTVDNILLDALATHEQENEATRASALSTTICTAIGRSEKRLPT